MKTEDIWNDRQKKLLVFIKGRVADESAEDILQEVFIKIHTKLKCLKENEKLENWLFKITRNSIVDYYRARKDVDGLPDWVAERQTAEVENIK